MTTYLYAVYDRLANSYGALVEYHTDGAAIRDFKRMFGKGVTADPSQYELHKIAKLSRIENSFGVSELNVVDVKDKGVIYNYSAFVSERLDGNDLVDLIALLDQDSINKVHEFVKSLDGGKENGSI